MENVVHRLVDPEEFKTGMRSLAGAVNIVTSMYAGCRYGMTATAVCSVSVAPPTVLVCVNRNAKTHGAIEKSGAFCINVLRAEHRELSLAFSGAQSGEARFSIAEWSHLATGSPVLVPSLVSLDCRVAKKITHGTHTIFLGAVGQILFGKKGRPLLYVEGKHARIAS
ncbi:MAG: flavin reductase family protein [Candidatus Kerfeldbacteria bacterium]|nr:flavin reductase family protein [Candidatus Kerfeldbacteria bacterium]